VRCCILLGSEFAVPRLFFSVVMWRQSDAEDAAAPIRLLRDLLGLGADHLADAREERPLVGPWHERVIEEHAVALLSGALLQGQGNQVAESALRHRVLVGEQAIVRIQPDIRAALHGFGQHVRPESASQRGRDSTVEEDPDVSSATGARAFERGRQPDFPVFRLSNRRGYASSRPRKRERKSAIVACAGDEWLTTNEVASVDTNASLLSLRPCRKGISRGARSHLVTAHPSSPTELPSARRMRNR